MIKITGLESKKVYYINHEKIASITQHGENGEHAQVLMDSSVVNPKIYIVSESAELLARMVVSANRETTVMAQPAQWEREPVNA